MFNFIIKYNKYLILTFTPICYLGYYSLFNTNKKNEIIQNNNDNNTNIKNISFEDKQFQYFFEKWLNGWK